MGAGSLIGFFICTECSNLAFFLFLLLSGYIDRLLFCCRCAIVVLLPLRNEFSNPVSEKKKLLRRHRLDTVKRKRIETEKKADPETLFRI